MAQKPNFFIVGAPKCGTTALYDYLTQHPDIYMSPVKEPHFFSTDLEPPSYVREDSAYMDLFQQAEYEKMIGEASASYLYSKVAAEKIKQFSPNAKIILMLRNPVELLYSLHSERLFALTEEFEKFEDALNAEEKRKKGLLPIKGAFALYRDVVTFCPQIERYWKHFGKDKVHIILQDDFRKDTEGVFRETLRFLGLEMNVKVEFGIRNANKESKSKLLRKLLIQPPDLVVNMGRILLPKIVRNALLDTLHRFNTVHTSRKPMDPDLKRELTIEFKPQVEQLGNMIGRDLSKWYAGI